MRKRVFTQQTKKIMQLTQEQKQLIKSIVPLMTIKAIAREYKVSESSLTMLFYDERYKVNDKNRTAVKAVISEAIKRCENQLKNLTKIEI